MAQSIHASVRLATLLQHDTKCLIAVATGYVDLLHSIYHLPKERTGLFKSFLRELCNVLIHASDLLSVGNG